MSAERIIDAYATIQARTEDTVEDNQDRYRARVEELLSSPDERMPSVWVDHLAQYFGNDLESIETVFLYDLDDLTAYAAELGHMPPELSAAFFVSARIQATLELNAVDLVTQSEKTYLGVHALAQVIDVEDVRAAAEKGVSKQEIKDRRRNGKPRQS